MNSDSMQTSTPVHISVILPVYNGAEYLEDAIKSILDQTYTHFECIIINDGSTDNSTSVIKKNMDSRFRLYEQENQGLAATLNRAIGLAAGKYVARQDQDDISLPRRLEKQVEFLENHLDHGMVGTWASIVDIEGKSQERTHKHPTESLILKFELLFNNPFVHSSMMIRKSVFDKVGMYSTDALRQPPEDYELWSRIAREFEVANIPEILHIYREVSSSMSRDGINPFLDRVINISGENLAWATGRQKHDKNINDYTALIHGAHYRLSPKPDHGGMSSLLYEAADRLSDSFNVNRELLREIVHARVRSIVRPCLQQRYGKIMSRIMEHFYKAVESAK